MNIGNLAVGICCTALLSAGSALASAQSSSDGLSPESAVFAQYQADLAAANPDGTVPNRYIVTLSEAVPRLDELGLERQVQVILGRAGGGEILGLYQLLHYGFAARLSPEQAALLKASPLVARMEPSRLTSIEATPVQNNPPSWGLDRIDQADRPLDQKYYYPSSAGAGAHVFIVDSGIRSTHQDFAGRIRTGKSTVPGSTSTEDCNGHGTHVAGTAVGTAYGVAKRAWVYPVRTQNCAGGGDTVTAYNGLEWVTQQVYYYNKKPAVVNYSITAVGARDATVEAAAKKMVKDYDISFVAAAGNDTVDACQRSPAAVPEVLTVAASDSGDRRGGYSNYGSCVDLFAPGSSIVSASHQSDSGSATMTGTSMAAPHVAGAMAYWRGPNPASSAASLQDALLTHYTVPDKISDPRGSPNRLLHIVTDKPPTAAFSARCSILNLSRTCSFDASTSSDKEGIVSYSWNFGDGSTGTGKNVTHTYAGTLAQYAVTLTVTDTAQQTGSITQNVLNIGVLP